MNLNKIFTEIHTGTDLIIPACDGTEIIENQKDNFTVLSDYFYKVNQKKVVPTPETKVKLYSLNNENKNITSMKIFNSFDKRVGELFLTTHQIKIFCDKHFVWLNRFGRYTIFLHNGTKNYYVLRVNQVRGPFFLGIDAEDYSYGRTWVSGDQSPWIVIPSI